MSLLYKHVEILAITIQDMNLKSINNNIVIVYRYKNCHFSLINNPSANKSRLRVKSCILLTDSIKKNYS